MKGPVKTYTAPDGHMFAQDAIHPDVWRAARQARKAGTTLVVIDEETVRIVNVCPAWAKELKPRTGGSRVGSGRMFAGDRGTDRY